MYPELWIYFRGGSKPKIFYDNPVTGEEEEHDISKFTTQEIYNWLDSRDFKRLDMSQDAFDKGEMTEEQRKIFEARQDKIARKDELEKQERAELRQINENAHKLMRESMAKAEAAKAAEEAKEAAEAAETGDATGQKPATAEAETQPQDDAQAAETAETEAKTEL